MTKQEQIKEMAEELDITYTGAEEILIYLHKKGWIKPTEDSVILTKEEYIDLSRTYVKEQKEQAVKEFAEKLKESIFDYFGVKTIEEARQELSLIASTLTYDVVIDRIDELLKEYEK